MLVALSPGTRYETTETPDDPSAEATSLLAPKWPTKLDPMEYQAMVSEKLRARDEARLGCHGRHARHLVAGH